MISYFLPNKMAANPQNILDVGLDMLLREGDASPRFADLAGTGPGDQPGQLVSWTGEGLAYLPEQQTWTPALPDPKRELKAERYWIGTRKGEKPTPKELARTENATHDGVPMISSCRSSGFDLTSLRSLNENAWTK